MFFVSTGMFIDHIPYYLVATKYSAYINTFSVWSDFHFVLMWISDRTQESTLGSYSPPVSAPSRNRRIS
jgi:hypothetical protein